MGRVLVVDDDRAVCSLLTGALEEAGLEARCVHTAIDAFTALKAPLPYEAMIVDINLRAGPTGFDVARFARRSAPDLAIVYVSGDASLDSFETFGVPNSDFIEKPFTPEDVVRTLTARLTPRRD